MALVKDLGRSEPLKVCRVHPYPGQDFVRMLTESRRGGPNFRRRIRQTPDRTDGPKAPSRRVVNVFQDIELGHLWMGT